MSGTCFLIRPHFAAAIAGVLACLGGTPTASGDITSANWVNNTLFHYRVQHMPDLDQRRAGMLDAFGVDCGGSIHCVPTCTTNMMMYTANHGYPGVVPGPGYWEGQTNYVLATETIEDMGEDMFTNCATGGTNGGNASAAMVAWLAGQPGLVVNDHLSIGAFAPTHAGIGQSLCAGRIGSISYGRYDIVGEFKGIPLVDRNGGHCTTAVKVRRNGATRELWVRDPAADDGDNTQQGPFVNTIWTVTDLTVIVMPDIEMKTMTAINYDPASEVVRLIDGHRTITPAQGYSWDSSLGAVVYLGPMNFLNPTAPPTQTFPSPTGTPVLWLAWHDVTNELLMVCAGANGNTLQALDPVRNTSRSVPLPPTHSPQLLATGPGDEVYYYTLNRCFVKSWSTSGDADDPPGESLELPHVAHVMAYDDARDDLVLISRTDRRLMRTPKTLSGPVNVQTIPTAVPLGVRLQIAFNPNEDGVVYLWTDASNLIWRLQSGAGGLSAAPLNLPAAPLPRSLDFDDRGHMLVNNNGTLIEFAQNTTGVWQVVPASLFGGRPAGSNFRLTRSRTNYTSGVHDTPGWTMNIDPALLPPLPSAPDCPADIAPNLNTDHQVNIDDMLAVINAWGPCASAIRCVSDIDGDHDTDVDDLLRVITGWGPCP